MSLKIQVPRISEEYRMALIDHLLTLTQYGRSDFYQLLNLISGHCQDIEVSGSMHGMGGVKSIADLLLTKDVFKLATYKEYLRFYTQGYTGGDFQHIFLDAYLSVVTDILLEGRLRTHA